MTYTQDLSHVFSDSIGAKGLKTSQLEIHRQKLLNCQEKLKSDFDKDALAFLKQPYLRKDLVDLEPIVRRFQDDFTDIIILGTGGSSLGGQTLQVLANDTPPFIHFLDNIDSNTFDRLFQKLNPSSTAFIVVSKSGGTVETLMQCLTCLRFWQTHNNEFCVRDHFLIITEEKESPLQKIADFWQIPTIAHDPKLGGRFSVLSPVGLLPALIKGIDGIGLREGAQHVLEVAFSEKKIEKNPVALGALTAALLSQKYPSTVMLPYIDRLGYFSKWYCQLWAESLGKNGKGSTPIAALGTVDQHSQLQLYLDGPSDKSYILIGKKMPALQNFSLLNQIPEDPTLQLLNQAGMDALMRAEYEATRDTLIKHQKPVRTLEVEDITSHTLGELLMHFMLETAFAAEILGVNAYDQPAVEEGKVLAKTYLKNMLK